MLKKDYKTTSVNIEKSLYLLAVSEGINFTGFLNRCLSLYLDVPEDPREKVYNEKSQYAVLRLRHNIERDMKQVMQEHAQEMAIEDAVKAKEAELIQFGKYLQKASAWPVFQRCLSRKDPDDDTLSLVTLEVNRMNGHTYSEMELWNRAITWYQKYGGSNSIGSSASATMVSDGGRS